MTQQKIDYSTLSTGYEFEPAVFQLNKEAVTAYLDAVESDKLIYEKDSIVPPMAVAALAMTAMAQGMSLPPGAIHVSQDLQLLNMAGIDDTLTSYARVDRKVERGKFHMLTIGINVYNQNNMPVITGETGFILPVS